MKPEQLITDEVIEKVWGNADFGKGVIKRDVVKYSLLKYACFYSTGKTAKCILIDLGLLLPNEELTKRGREYLYYSFKHQSQQNDF